MGVVKARFGRAWVASAALFLPFGCGVGTQKIYHMPQDAAGRACVSECEGAQVKCPIDCLAQYPMNFQNGMDTNNLSRQLCMSGCSGNYDSCVTGCGARIETVAVGQQPSSGSASGSGSGSGELAATGALGVGDRVSCNWLGKGTFYDGRVGELRGANVYINYDDGDVEETSPGMCRLVTKAPGSRPAPELAPTPTPTPTPGTTTAAFAVGDRVSCNWKGGGTFYDGRVGELRAGGRVFIQYDDGDVEETSPALCRTLASAAPVATNAAPLLQPGDRVSCNWLGKGTLYNGRVAELRAGGRVFIQYDDGDQEETSPGMCRKLF